MRRHRTLLLIALVPLAWCLVCGSAMAQQSASFQLSEYSFNAGGDPTGGSLPSSANYRITLDSIGGPALAVTLASDSFRSRPSFLGSHLPPLEVTGLRFTDSETLGWNAEAHAVRYNLYRDYLATLQGLAFGACHQANLSGTTASDSDPLTPGRGFFYLVTGRNRLHKDGPKGADSGGEARQGETCP